MHHSLENRGHMLTTKMFILWSFQNGKWTSPLHSSCWDGQKTYMERLIRSPDEEVMPSERCLVVGTSDCQEFWRVSGLLGSLKKSARVSRVIPTSGVLTQVGTSDIPNRKSCSDLAFWIPIRTVPNSWKTWKIRLGEVFYWDKTTPSIYMRGLRPIKFLSIQSSKTQHINSFALISLFQPPPAVHWVSRRDSVAS